MAATWRLTWRSDSYAFSTDAKIYHVPSRHPKLTLAESETSTVLGTIRKKGLSADGWFFLSFPRAYARGGERFPIALHLAWNPNEAFRAGTVHLSEASLGCILLRSVVERHHQFRAQ